LTLLCYWPVIHHGFISFDDHAYLIDNPHVTAGLTWPGLGWAFRTGYAANWHPITWISHMLDCQIFGLNPGGHHFTNVVFHIANSVLVCLCLYQMTAAMWRSAFVAALFAWHPLHVESVAWASERKDVLSTFFFLLTLMAYTRYVEAGRAKSEEQSAESGTSPPSSHLQSPIFYVLALLCFALGLMSKPMLVTVPFVLLLLDCWPLQRFQPGTVSWKQTLIPLLREKLPFFALSFAASAITVLVQKAAGAVSTLETTPLPLRLMNAVATFARYLGKTLWPTHLAVFYPLHHASQPGLLVLGSLLLLALLTTWFLLCLQRSPWLAVGWFWFLGTLIPTIGLVQVGSQAMADRYMYIPSIGLFLVLVWGVADFARFSPRLRFALACAGTAALALCLARTSDQLKYWGDGATLFRHSIAVTGNNYIACSVLGKSLDDLGRKNEALAAFEQAVQLDPASAEGQYNLGTALMERGRLDEAVRRLNSALAARPDYPEAHNNLWSIFSKQGNLELALPHLLKVLALTPENPEAHYNLGTLLLGQSKLQDGVAQLLEALRLKPEYADAHRNLGVALMTQGRTAEALPHFSEAVRLAPANAEARFNFGLARMDSGRPQEAAAQFAEGLRLKPEESRFHYHLGRALARLGNSEVAIQHFRAALRLTPDLADALNALAWILATAPETQLRSGSEAVRLATRACELTQYQQPTPVLTLAAAYAEAGQFADGTATAQKALDLAHASGNQALAEKAAEILKHCREHSIVNKRE
jgi:tetratricopeptide (TPR) repeat protein